MLSTDSFPPFFPWMKTRVVALASLAQTATTAANITAVRRRRTAGSDSDSKHMGTPPHRRLPPRLERASQTSIPLLVFVYALFRKMNEYPFIRAIVQHAAFQSCAPSARVGATGLATGGLRTI